MTSRAQRRDQLEDARQRRAGARARVPPRAAAPGRRPSGRRTARRARSASAPAATAARTSRGVDVERRIAGGEDTARARPRPRARSAANVGDAAHVSCTPRWSRHRAHVLVAAAGEVDEQDAAARRCAARGGSACATACALSSAGMMPSVAVSSRSASTASSSVTVTYVARPLSRSHACSGPTPGIVEAGRDRVRVRGSARSRPAAGSVLLPCRTPTCPADERRGVRAGLDARARPPRRRSAATRGRRGRRGTGPIALLPPPTHAMQRVGQPPGGLADLRGAPRGRSPPGSRAPSADTGAGPATEPIT
mgnify:CR=1 FL=1